MRGFACAIAIIASGCLSPPSEAAKRAIMERLAADVAAAKLDNFHHFGAAGVPPGPYELVGAAREGVGNFTPSAYLVRAANGTELVLCSNSGHVDQAYPRAAFTVSWKELCPYDGNYIAQPPDGREPGKTR